ncbi:MAG TPA: CapA family protein [Gemmatimonadaceae bacterium]|nr:CapA family protein [Gemmatimonadaceae bacterium]
MRILFAVGLFSGVAFSTATAQVRDTVRQILPDTLVAKQSQDTTRRPLRLCAAGDVTLGNNLDSAWARRAAANLWDRYARSAEPDSMLAPLRELFADADVVLINVEGAIGEGPATKKCSPRSTSCYAFRSPRAAAWALRALGSPTARVVGNVANNHSHDAGVVGLKATMGLLDSAGVQVTGADTLATPVITHRGDTLAFLGFYTAATSPNARDLAGVRRHVSRAVASYGTVIVTMHLGAEGASAQRTRNVDETFVGTLRGNPVAFANAAVDAGATAVIGHGPHVLRAGEWKDSSLVLYSLGNFVNYGTFSLKEPMNRGAVACLEIAAPRRVRTASIASTVQIAPGVVLWDWSGRSAAIIDSLSGLDFPGTGIAVAPEGTVGRRSAIAVPIRKPD